MRVVALGLRSHDLAYVDRGETFPGEAHADVALQGALDGFSKATEKNFEPLTVSR
jgi:hypothetical protein